MKKILLCFSLILAFNDVFAQESNLVLPENRLTLSYIPAINDNHEQNKNDFNPVLDRLGFGISSENMLTKKFSFIGSLRYFRIPKGIYSTYTPPTVDLLSPGYFRLLNPYSSYLSLSLGFRFYDLRGEAPFFFEFGAAPVSNISINLNQYILGYYSAYMGCGVVFQYSKKLYGTIEPIFYYPLTSYDDSHFFSSFALNLGVGMKI